MSLKKCQLIHDFHSKFNFDEENCKVKSIGLAEQSNATFIFARPQQ
jgi:hypothetical protein